MPRFARLGSEFQVNTTTTGFAYLASVAALSTGGFVVVWEADSTTGSSADVRGQAYDASGVASNGEFRANSVTGGFNEYPSITGLPGGGFAVAWDVYANGSNQAQIRFFGANGQPLGAEVAGIAGSAQVSLGRLSDNSVIVLADYYYSDLTNREVLRGQHLTADGQKIGNSFNVNSPVTGGGASDTQVVPLAGGNFVATWDLFNFNPANGSQSYLGSFAQVMTPTGTPVGSRIKVGESSGEHFYTQSLALADGSFVLAWEDGSSMLAQHYAADGTAQGSAYRLDTDSGSYLAQLPDGSIVAAYSSYAPGATGIYAKHLSIDGTALGTALRVHATVADATSAVDAASVDGITVTSAGDVVVIWEGGGVFGQRLDVQALSPAIQRDFAGNGHDAILWRSDDGAQWQWQTDGSRITAQGGGPVGTDWHILGTGDFDGDGRADILWRHDGDGVTWLWQMNGTAITGGGYVASVDASWSVLAVRDFTGDGRTDILWRHAGDNQLWLFAMNGNGIEAARSGGLQNPGAPWVPVAAGDFSGDGKGDILWQNNTTGTWYVWAMNGTAIIGQADQGLVAAASGLADFAVAGIGDFDGNGTEDILFRSAGTGTLVLWTMAADLTHAEATLLNPGLDWAIAAVGDYTGDGRADILWRHQASGDVYLWAMNGAAIASQHDYGVVPGNWHIVA